MITDGDSYRRRHAQHHKSPIPPRVSVVVLPIAQRGMLWLTWWRATSLPSGGVGPAGRDISYIKTWQGWLRLEAVIDLEQGRDRLCDGRAHTRPAGHRRAGDGGRATTSSKKTALCLSTAAAKYMSGEYSATFAELELRQSVGHTRILLG